jgi:hypothetical protein
VWQVVGGLWGAVECLRASGGGADA